MKFNIDSLDRSFVVEYNRLQNAYPERLGELNGFSDKQLNYTDFIDGFIDKQTIADASIDGNANVSHKDIVSLINEMSKPHSKLLAFNKIFHELTKKYGHEDAVKWLKGEWDGHFYLHDAYSSSYVPYCFAYDIERLVNEGLYFIDNFNAAPPQHLNTYTDFVGEFVSWTCNRSSGAVGLPSFLIYSYYFWKKDCDEGYYTKSPEYYRDQSFQEIIYRLNQPYLRGGIQSAFTNFSVFDKPYLEALFGGKEFPDGTFIIDYIDEIKEYQKAFMKVLSNVRRENMMTFPVMTFALLRQNGKFVDEDFAKWCCRHNMKWADSNIFVSEDVTSLSNCCFSGEQKVLVRFSGDNIESTTFKKICNTHPASLRKKIEVFHDGEWKKCRVVKLPARPLYKILTINDAEIIVTDNHINPTARGDITTKELTLDDSLMFSSKTPALQVKKNPDGQPVYYKIKSIEPISSDDPFCYCFEMADEDEPYFTLPNGVITHNCRLKSNIKDLGYFNSIGGSALEVGSVKVNTINLARVAYENATEKEYLTQLKDEVVTCIKALDIIRNIMKRNAEKGLLPNYSLGIINMDSQYNTVGIIGVYEALQKFGYTYKDEFGYTYYTDKGVGFAKKILATITEVKDEFAKASGYMINIEQVPGERAAAVLMDKDKLFFPNESYDLPLYGNQWIPLGIKTTIAEKVRVSAILDKACSGGSIVHINISSPFTDFDEAWRMMNYVADAGVNYFAFNLRISACDNNHGFFGSVCPECGHSVETTYQRIVGFLTPTKTYSKERKAEFAMRDWFDVNSMGEI